MLEVMQMMLDSGERQYDVVRSVLSGIKNDVIICREIGSVPVAYKTVWVIKDRKLAKQLLNAFEKCRNGHGHMDCFAVKENLCFVLPYHEERPLEKFYISTVREGKCAREQIWLELTKQCMVATVPDSIIYLIFTQGHLHLQEDGSVFFDYCLDMSAYEENKDIRDCVEACAGEILYLANMESVRDATAVELLEKKVGHREYADYLELYKDIRLLAQKEQKGKLVIRLVSWIAVRKEQIYGAILGISVALLITVLMILIFRGIYGDSFLFRLFGPPIEQIGTESLLQ